MEDHGNVPAKKDVYWPTVLWYIHIHALGFYGLTLLFTEAKWLTVFFAVLTIFVAVLGVTAGAHRLWAHQSFEASWFIRLFLILAHTLVGVGPVYDWVLKHRMHHRFYGTEKDPYNHGKGFFYSHVISNCLTDDPHQEKVEKDIDMRDVESDGFVWLQRRFYWVLFIIVGLLLPINAPAEYWGESLMNSVFILGFMRLAIMINISWLVNSAMIIWGLKPGDKLMTFFTTASLFYMLFFKMPKNHGTVVINGDGLHAIYPADDNTIFILHKSYWPNYHYLLPWDWKSGEFGTYDRGCTSFFIKMWDALGLVSSLKTTSSEMVRDALYRLASDKKVTKEDVLDDVKKIADEEAKKIKLTYFH